MRKMPRAVQKVGRFEHYLHETQGPLASLIFVLPLVAVYELANRGLLGSVEAGPGEQLVAFALLRQAFNAASATGALLPALALVACLLGWQIGQRRAWTIRLHYLAMMALEATLLALPIAALAMMATRWLPWSAAIDEIPLTRMATLSIGAALYEELIFRLLGFVILHGIAVDLFGLRRSHGIAFTIVGSAVLFAAYHYLGLEQFAWPSFVFRTIAGSFLATLFLIRGFGITVGCHAVYDLCWVIVLRQHLAI